MDPFCIQKPKQMFAQDDAVTSNFLRFTEKPYPKYCLNGWKNMHENRVSGNSLNLRTF